MKDIPAGFRKTQRLAGIWNDGKDSFLDEIEPRKGQEDALTAVREMAEGKRKLLVLVGESRSGKSHLLAGFANYKLRIEYNTDAQKTAKYMTFFEMELALRSAQTKGNMDVLFRELVDYPELVIDELGRGKWSEFTSTFFTNVLIKRKGEGRETLIATNLNGSELKEMFDIALLERLREENGVVLIKK